MAKTRQSRIIRFGSFEVDPAAGELWKDRVKIRIQQQPFQILITLLERPGEMVPREDLSGNSGRGSKKEGHLCCGAATIVARVAIDSPYRGNEAVRSSSNRLNEDGRFCRVAQDVAQPPDRGIEPMVEVDEGRGSIDVCANGS